MEILRKASAGTVESSDVQVFVEKGSGKLDIEIASPVARAFFDSIHSAVLDVCQSLAVTDAKISLQDHGALDCTIRARVETALSRAGEENL